MKKLAAYFLTVVLVLLTAGCGSGQAQPDTSPDAAPTQALDKAPQESPAAYDDQALTADAQAISDALLSGDFESVTARFDETLAGALSTDALKAGWDAAIINLGAYIERAYTESAEADGYYIVDVAEKYENNGLLLHVTYDAGGNVAGLNLTYIDLSEPEESEFYTELELTVAGDPSLPLAATLTLPTGAEKPPVVILVHGSGVSDRDENIYGNKPFADIAHGLAEYGIATLRYDKRYYTNPELAPSMDEVTLRQEALDDVSAAIALMERDSRVDGQRIYVLGHSLGGMLTPAIAAEHPELSGIISMAGSLRPLWEICYDQNQEALQTLAASGLSDSDLALLNAQAAQIEADIAVLRGDLSTVSNDTTLMGIPAGYWKSVSEYCGMNFIDQVEMPILVLQGSADFQVYADKDFTLWQETIGARGNVRLCLYEGLNHLMMPSLGLRDISEYQVKSHVDAQVIEDIASFIVK